VCLIAGAVCRLFSMLGGLVFVIVLKEAAGAPSGVVIFFWFVWVLSRWAGVMLQIIAERSLDDTYDREDGKSRSVTKVPMPTEAVLRGEDESLTRVSGRNPFFGDTSAVITPVISSPVVVVPEKDTVEMQEVPKRPDRGINPVALEMQKSKPALSAVPQPATQVAQKRSFTDAVDWFRALPNKGDDELIRLCRRLVMCCERIEAESMESAAGKAQVQELSKVGSLLSNLLVSATLLAAEPQNDSFFRSASEAINRDVKWFTILAPAKMNFSLDKTDLGTRLAEMVDWASRLIEKHTPQ